MKHARPLSSCGLGTVALFDVAVPRNICKRQRPVASDRPPPCATAGPAGRASRRRRPRAVIPQPPCDARASSIIARAESAGGRAVSAAAGAFKDGAWGAIGTSIWEGDETQAMEAASSEEHVHPWQRLSPAWKVMLLSDGSVTRHLQLLTGLPVDVECIEMRDIGRDVAGLPEEAELITGDVVQRQVFLRTGSNTKVQVYAVSWWNKEEVEGYLQDKEKPIWVSLSEGRTEMYREIKRVYYGTSPELQRVFDSDSPLWARHYIFWHCGKPLTIIYEVFSPSLEEYLGPSCTEQ